MSVDEARWDMIAAHPGSWMAAVGACPGRGAVQTPELASRQPGRQPGQPLAFVLRLILHPKVFV
jgi:hypothetical protein